MMQSFVSPIILAFGSGGPVTCHGIYIFPPKGELMSSVNRVNYVY